MIRIQYRNLSRVVQTYDILPQSVFQQSRQKGARGSAALQPNNHITQITRGKNVLTSPFIIFGGRNLFGVTRRVCRKNIEALDLAVASKPKWPPISPKPQTRAQILFSVSHAKRMCSLTCNEIHHNHTSEVRRSTPNELNRRCQNLLQNSSPASQHERTP